MRTRSETRVNANYFLDSMNVLKLTMEIYKKTMNQTFYLYLSIILWPETKCSSEWTVTEGFGFISAIRVSSQASQWRLGVSYHLKRMENLWTLGEHSGVFGSYLSMVFIFYLSLLKEKIQGSEQWIHKNQWKKDFRGSSCTLFCTVASYFWREGKHLGLATASLSTMN